MNAYFGLSFDELKDFYSEFDSKPECMDKGFVEYMNADNVRKALHVSDHVRSWSQGSSLFHYKMQYSSMKSRVKELVEKHKIPTFIVFNGDIDMVCDFLGDQQFVDELGFKLLEKYRRWTVGGRTAGFVKRYEGISFMTVRNAGHMVPTDQPEAAFAIVKELIGISKIA